MYLIESQDWGVSKRVQENVSSDTMVKHEGSVAARNGHLAKRSPQVVEGAAAAPVAAGGAAAAPVAAGGAVALTPADDFFIITKKTYILGIPKLYKKIIKKYGKSVKTILSPFIVKTPKFPFLGAKVVKPALVLPVGTILGAATLGGGAIGAGILGTGAKATLGVGALGAGTLGAATLGAGALGSAAVAGTAGVAGMWCMTKTYSKFKLYQVSNITV